MDETWCHSKARPGDNMDSCQKPRGTLWGPASCFQSKQLSKPVLQKRGHKHDLVPSTPAGKTALGRRTGALFLLKTLDIHAWWLGADVLRRHLKGRGEAPGLGKKGGMGVPEPGALGLDGPVPAVLWYPWSSTPTAPGPNPYPALTQMTSGTPTVQTLLLAHTQLYLLGSHECCVFL